MLDLNDAYRKLFDMASLHKGEDFMIGLAGYHEKKHGKFVYVVVPEFHADDVSMHFHALLKGYAGTLKEVINPHTGKLLIDKGQQVYSIVDYCLGHTQAKKITNTPVENNPLTWYLTREPDRKYETINGTTLIFNESPRAEAS